MTNALGMTAYRSGARDEAIEAFRETVAASESVGNHTAAIYALGYLAAISAERDDYTGAQDLVDLAMSLAGRQDLAEQWVTVMVHYAAGYCARARGEFGRARTAIQRGLDLARRGGLRLDVVYGLLALMPLAAVAGDRREARDLAERAERQLAACPDPGILRNRLDRADRVSASSVTKSRPAADDLSRQELAVLHLMPSQLSLREIGDEMYISFNTVKTHARNIYAMLRVSSRADAVARARELHLL